jgi:gliding motility-associated-like protein
MYKGLIIPFFCLTLAFSFSCKKMKVRNNACLTETTITLSDNFKSDSVYILVPNIFTPNGDGINDLFYIIVEGVSSMEFKVYNKGKEVFYSNKIMGGWDGKINDKVKSGNYKFVANITTIHGGTVSIEGTVTSIGEDVSNVKIEHCSQCLPVNTPVYSDLLINCK